jgi:outer membrane PBP1 activator LpoA protein
MQRRLILSLLLPALLYFAASGISTQQAAAMGFDYRPIERPPVNELQRPPVNEETAPPTNTSIFTKQGHIAVILPLQSIDFRRLAEQVRLGILTASNLAYKAPLPIIFYSTTTESQRIREAYERAVSDGAKAVIGPLTRKGVSELAQSGVISVPTVALNVPYENVILPRQNYAFGLQIESEARQTAKLAFAQGGRKVLVLMANTALSQRISRAFVSEWIALKGDVADRFTYTTDPASLVDLRALLTETVADVVFVSVDAPRARFIRPYLGNELPIYATSLVYASNADRTELYDLNGVRFLDMPWLLLEDHPAVLAYLRPAIDSDALDEERFYALGIDAFRITQGLLDNPAYVSEIDGVTGTIRLDERRYFTRELTPAHFAWGRVRLFARERSAVE